MQPATTTTTTTTTTSSSSSSSSTQETLSPTLPANHRNATNALLATLAELETMLAPLFATPSALNETLAKLETEKRCQLELMVAYAINTLAYITLKANGIAPSNHQVINELKRIKAYTEKLRQAIHGNRANMNMEVDKDAAARFIRGALAANEIADRKAVAAEAEEERGTHHRYNNDDDQDKEKEEKDASTNTRPTKAQKLDGSSTITSSTPSTSSTSASTSASIASKSSSSSSSTRRRAMDPFQGPNENSKKRKNPDAK